MRRLFRALVAASLAAFLCAPASAQVGGDVPFSTPIPFGVSFGGTGATSFTANAFLTGNGTGALNAVALTGIVAGNGASAPTGVTSCASGVLIYSAGSVPSCGTTLPSGLAATNLALTTPSLGAATGTSLTLSGLTSGSVLFAGTSGLVSQDNANFFWDDTNDRLAIGMAAPQSRLHLAPSATGFRTYNTYTDASNSEWFEAVWAANVLTLGTNKNGTGSARNLQLEVGGAVKLDYGVSNAGGWTFWTSAFINGVFSIAAADVLPMQLISGTTNGIRLGFDGAGNPTIEGVDRTGVGTYQKLNLGGSMIALSINGAAKQDYGVTTPGTWTFYDPVTFTGAIKVPGTTTAAFSSTGTFTSGAGAQVGTITNAPVAGNPTSWIKIIDNGVTRYIPAW